MGASLDSALSLAYEGPSVPQVVSQTPLVFSGLLGPDLQA